MEKSDFPLQHFSEATHIEENFQHHFLDNFFCVLRQLELLCFLFFSILSIISEYLQYNQRLISILKKSKFILLLSDNLESDPRSHKHFNVF